MKRGTQGQSFFWAVLFFTAIAAALLAGVCVKYTRPAESAEIPERYLPERITPFVVEGVFAALEERPALRLHPQPGWFARSRRGSVQRSLERGRA